MPLVQGSHTGSPTQDLFFLTNGLLGDSLLDALHRMLRNIDSME